ncbi:MAG TPA: transcriptional regulator [Lunatimonas sp.]|nr:transcriptional regulator [Lunatimonas sp.]
MKDFLKDFNKAFENKIRLGVMSALMVNDSVDFNTLKDLLNATDGNLASHLKTLEKEAYIAVSKRFVDRKPLTTYTVTTQGKEAFEKHLSALENLLK